jgi:hypothetical protein
MSNNKNVFDTIQSIVTAMPRPLNQKKALAIDIYKCINDDNNNETYRVADVTVIDRPTSGPREKLSVIANFKEHMIRLENTINAMGRGMDNYVIRLVIKLKTNNLVIHNVFLHIIEPNSYDCKNLGYIVYENILQSKESTLGKSKSAAAISVPNDVPNRNNNLLTSHSNPEMLSNIDANIKNSNNATNVSTNNQSTIERNISNLTKDILRQIEDPTDQIKIKNLLLTLLENLITYYNTLDTKKSDTKKYTINQFITNIKSYYYDIVGKSEQKDPDPDLKLLSEKLNNKSMKKTLLTPPPPHYQRSRHIKTHSEIIKEIQRYFNKGGIAKKTLKNIANKTLKIRPQNPRPKTKKNQAPQGLLRFP